MSSTPNLTDAAPPDTPAGFESWTFTAVQPDAGRAYLVLDDGGPSRWVQMQPVVGQPGTWDARVRLRPGRYRARHFIAQGGTFINCGDLGLTGTRTGAPCPGVVVDQATTQAA